MREAVRRIEEEMVSGGCFNEYERGAGIGARTKKVNGGVIASRCRN